MSNADITIGFVPIARPTFDVELAREMTTQVYETLSKMGYGIIGAQDLIMDGQAIAERILELQSSEIDLLLMLQSSFADSTMVVELAKAVDAPLLMWALPEERVGGRLRLNSFCGINLAGHGLRRVGIRYNYIYALPDEESALKKLQTIATASGIKSKLRGTRIGRVGENPAGFDTCLVNYEGLQSQLGVEIVQFELETIFEGARHAEPAKVNAIAEQVRSQVAGIDEMDATATKGTLSTFVTLDEIAKKQNLSGMAVRCWPEFFTDLGCSACGAMSMMSNKMTPCSCEADVNGTITQLILQEVSGEPAFGTDLVSFDVEKDEAVLWHCGLAPLSMADPDFQPEATIHSNRKMPLLMQFPLKPGRVTVARLSEASGEFRLVIGGGEMLKAPASFTGTSGTIRFDRGAQAVMDTIMEEGLEHHVSLTYGDYGDVLEALARLLGLSVLRL